VTPLRHFSSDNNAGALPEVLRAIAEANSGHVPSYGGDPYTANAEAALQEGIRRRNHGLSGLEWHSG
jgi:Threonine aldolase